MPYYHPQEHKVLNERQRELRSQFQYWADRKGGEVRQEDLYRLGSPPGCDPDDYMAQLRDAAQRVVDYRDNLQVGQRLPSVYAQEQWQPFADMWEGVDTRQRIATMDPRELVAVMRGGKR